MTGDFHTDVDTLFHDWNYRHPRLLHGLIRWLEPDVVVEVGSFRGYAAAWMARALYENDKGTLFCIDDFSAEHQYGRDPLERRRHMEDNLSKLGVSHRVEIIEGQSHRVQWPKKVDMAFIDAHHSRRACVHDVNQALTLGARVIAVDNTRDIHGPRCWAQVFRELLEGGGWSEISVGFQGGITIAMEAPCEHPPGTEEVPDLDLSMATTEYGEARGNGAVATDAIGIISNRRLADRSDWGPAN